MRARGGTDEGFTLIEQVMALFLAAVVFMALAGAAMAGVRASLASRANQQATDFMTRAIEQARGTSFGALAHQSGSVSGMPGVTNCGAGTCEFDPGTGTLEEMITVPSGAGVLNQQTPAMDNANNITFTVYTYVTVPQGEDPEQVRRVTAVAEWRVYGRDHSRHMSTLVSVKQEGLPLPKFKLVPQGDVDKQFAGSTRAYFGAVLTNQGAPDAWNLTVSVSPGMGGTWKLYLDDGDGSMDLTHDTLFTDHNSDGLPDTGTLTPNRAVLIWLVNDLNSGEPSGPRTVSLTAKSIGQPTSPTASQTLPFGLTISSSVPTPTSTVTSTGSWLDCPAPSPAAFTFPGGYTPAAYTLHNGDGSANSTASMNPLVMSATSPYYSTLGAYSTDADLLPGRRVPAASSVQWRSPGYSAKASIAGKPRLHLWVNGALTARSVTVTVEGLRSNGNVASASAPQTFTLLGTGCLGWQEVWIDMNTITSVDVPKNGMVAVTVTPSSTMRLAYDTGAYPATFVAAKK
ncbi:MAG: type II secretion system protein J [Actinomycetales bacterium]